MTHSDVINSILEWNNRFPLDRWWRNKYGISFMSPAHRESSFLDQLFEFEEDKLFAEMFSKKEKKDGFAYVPGSGDIFKAPETQEAFVDEAEREIQEMLTRSGNGGEQEDKSLD